MVRDLPELKNSATRASTNHFLDYCPYRLSGIACKSVNKKITYLSICNQTPLKRIDQFYEIFVYFLQVRIGRNYFSYP